MAETGPKNWVRQSRAGSAACGGWRDWVRPKPRLIPRQFLASPTGPIKAAPVDGKLPRESEMPRATPARHKRWLV